jgi:hypothetical protein
MTRLAEERTRRGWKKSHLVHHLMAEAARRGIGIAPRDSLMRMIAQWENDHRSPSEIYGGLLCAVYGREADELGLSVTSPTWGSKAGLVYEPQLGAAISALADLSRLDRSGHSSVSRGALSVDALNAASLDWLFAAHTDDRRPVDKHVRPEDVAEISTTTAAFDALDRRFGGEHSRAIAVNYLRDRVLPRLNARYSDEVGRELHTATAALCELIGWMAYDTARHSLGQRYFIQALRFAREAGDKDYGAYVVTSMSDQALFLERPDVALRLAHVAGADASGPPPTVLAEAAMLEARANAALGNRAGASSALLRAERHFDRVGHSELPAWASRFDATVMASHAGTCWIALERPHEAREALSLVWDQASGQPRRQAYAAAQLAAAAVLDGDIDEACAMGTVAANSTQGMTSARARHHVSTLARRLKPHSQAAAVRDFNEHLHTLDMNGAA